MEYSDPPPLTSRPGRPHARRPYDRHRALPALADRELAGEVDEDDSDDAYDSAAARMAATPPKRGPGRPRKDGLPPQKRRVVQYVEARVEGGDVVGLFPPPSRPSQQGQQQQEKKRGPGRPKGSKNKKTLRMSAGGYLPQPQLRLEKWEKETGTLVGPVRSWPDGRGEEEDVELAYAGTSIDLRSVADLSFRYAKILSTPFFGCGLVELPAGAVKRTKNARKMQMCFFVSEGKVLVDVAGSEFRISRGGVWVVPRGNTYSITNDYDLPARIFFAQGCEVEAPPPPPAPSLDEDEEEAASPEKPAPRLESLGTKERDRDRDRDRRGQGEGHRNRQQIRSRHEREESTMEQSRRGESMADSSDEEGERRQRQR
ncbi:MAG: hypothetical protein M1824_003294 [Vezdaea acicularis]|nr:MAG: hypothetical protein M1824_003294 [Vezdaea acicularis]